MHTINTCLGLQRYQLGSYELMKAHILKREHKTSQSNSLLPFQESAGRVYLIKYKDNRTDAITSTDP